ncbi:hypothetical protein AYO20_05735 [Fonsecaea nubica]|uniref:CBF1-interacting co-repressor CIR N-terminal domain-containing protein n=1 Tax=Fonsecaea nubica TaxID=856822 RepID=A0A178CYS2_9EURO|nr:hypothetical protein AYO20_05735 [Fonsecaea nubica]OAL35020.1 hypothetical protein AYO20_05735 [Fonsecaea nubica]
MPLHLLHKKSWNVYSPANIERVKRDEAKARDQAAEQEKNDLRREADDRLSILQQQGKGKSRTLKRKLPGEDDTDRDIRLALESTSKSTSKPRQDYASLVDAGGHISLVPAPEKRSHVDQQQRKDPYTVYLSDAVNGRDGPKDTWYTSIQPEREKWGDEDPRKQERELTRLNANDPLAAMKRGVKALRENERQRQEWMKERERDLAEVKGTKRNERHHRKRKRRTAHDKDDLESLEEFNLDEGYTKAEVSARHQERRSEHRHRRRHEHHRHHRHHRHGRQKENHQSTDEDLGHRKEHEHQGRGVADRFGGKGAETT